MMKEKIYVGLKNPSYIIKGIGQLFVYAGRIIRHGSFSVNVNTKEFWNRKLAKFGSFWRDAHYRHILGLLPSDRPFTLLDIGCALGDGAELILGRFPKAKITATDISEVGIRKAIAKTRGVKYLVHDILKDEIPARYDHIVIVETLEHFDDPMMVVDKCLRHCDGSLIISVPYTPGRGGKINFVDEHRYSFNEETFGSYPSARVVEITDFMEETKSRCIIYEIRPGRK